MASRRSRPHLRISFFSFQDIIMATTCILVLVTMMLSTFLNGGNSSEEYVEQATRDLHAQLKSVLDKLAALTAANDEMARRLSTLPPGGAEALKQEVDKLRAELRRQLEELGTVTETDARAARDQAANDSTHGIAATAREVQALRTAVEEMTDKADKLQARATELDKKVREADARLLAAVSEHSPLWLVPDLSSTTKEPLLIVVDSNGLSMERFNKPAARVLIQNKSKEQTLSEFRSQLDKLDRLNDYLVFYIKPSGIDLYNALDKAARTARFEIGYDALEEERTIIFSPPPADNPVR